MSFVRTLATLAAGYAAAKGMEHMKKMGGMAGVTDALGNNPQLAGMMEKMGIPGGAAGLQGMLGQLTGGAGGGTANAGAMAGLGGLMSALTGGAAAGSEQSAQMMDALTGTTAATDTMEANAKLMIRAMIQAAKADGEIDADERDRILQHMGDEIDSEERAFIEEQLAAPVDVMALVNDTSTQMKAQVYATSLMAVRVDEQSEADYLNQLADALGLPNETRAAIHKSMGLG
ncbi:MAG: DUF533 domain-containing protein [Pseudomonadota bacterium]